MPEFKLNLNLRHPIFRIPIWAEAHLAHHREPAATSQDAVHRLLGRNDHAGAVARRQPGSFGPVAQHGTDEPGDKLTDDGRRRSAPSAAPRQERRRR